MRKTRSISCWVVTIAILLPLLCGGRSQASEFMPLGPATRAVDFPSGRAAVERSATASSATTVLTCEDAIPIAVDQELAGSTLGRSSTVDLYGCGDEPETGPEQVYLLEVTEPTWFEVTIESNVDLDIVLLGGCDPLVDCLALGDVGVRSVEAVTGTFYIVVEGYAGAVGDYTLSVRKLVEIWIPPDICVVPVVDKGLISFSRWSTSCTGSHWIGGLFCSSNPTLGQESYPDFLLIKPGGSIDAQLTQSIADMALYLIGGCGPESVCLAAADRAFEGGDESLSWTNQSADPRMVWLLADTVGGSADCAEFHLSVTANVVLPAAEASWSTWKASFHGDGGGR